MATIHTLYRANCAERAIQQGYKPMSLDGEPDENSDHYFHTSSGEGAKWHDFLTPEEGLTLMALEVPSDAYYDNIADARRKAWAAFTPDEPDSIVLSQRWTRITRHTGEPVRPVHSYSYMGLGLQVAMDNTPDDDGNPSDWWSVVTHTTDRVFCEAVDVTVGALSRYYFLPIEVIDRLFDMQNEPGMTREQLDQAMLEAPHVFLIGEPTTTNPTV